MGPADSRLEEEPVKGRYLAAIVMVVALLAAGCGGSGNDSGGQAAQQEDKNLTVWLMDGSAPDKLVADLNTEFEAAHAGAKVTNQKQQWNGILDKLTTALASNDPPDVIELGNTQ